MQSLSEIRQLLQTKIFAHPFVSVFNPYSRSVLGKLSRCHSSAIGMHVYQCNNCQQIHYQYHCCGDRHCPNCGGMKREEWIQDRMNELIPTKYYHLVFTLPQELRSLCMGNRKVMFNLLFKCAHYTLLKLAKDDKYLGGTPGITSILHTNGQDLSFHPHIHSIVSGGGIDKDGKWIKEKRANGLFLFPRRAMEKIFKARFLHQLRQGVKDQTIKIAPHLNFDKLIMAVGYKKWNVYAKAPFGGPAQIIEYLGRYTHKVAISVNRIIAIDDQYITFKYKDYADRNLVKEMSLTHQEFLRRFEQHILPKRFVKIRHAGILTHRNKKLRITSILQQMDIKARFSNTKIPNDLQLIIKSGINPLRCKNCETGMLILIESFRNHNGQMVPMGPFKNKGSPFLQIQIP